MGSADYLDRFTDSANVHSGSAAGKYKRSSAGAMRHISWDLYTGNALIVGKGDTFSFWAKGVASNVEVKPRVSHVPLIHASNQTSLSDTTTATFTILANSDWTQYSFPISPEKQVYGFQFSFSSGGTTVYVPVDDIQIYTNANPWSVYVAPVSVTGVSVTPETMNLQLGDNGNLTATISPENATNQNISWSSEDELVATVSSSGQVSAVGVGQTLIVATTVDGGFEDACMVNVSFDPDSPLGKSFSGYTVLHHPLGGDINTFVVISLGDNMQAFVEAGTDKMHSTYSISDNVVTIVTGNSNYGTFIGSLNSVRDTLTKTSISGTYGSDVDDLVMVASSTIIEDGNNTTTAALQSRYTIDYDDGNGWKASTSNDRIEYKTSTPDPVEGDGSVKLKNGTFGKIRYKLANMSENLGTSFRNIGFWFNNTTAYSMKLQLILYESGGNNAQQVTDSLDVVANSGWVYCRLGLGYIYKNYPSFNIAGYSIILQRADATGHPCIDYISLF
jgi:hypothetical protein